MRSCGNVGAAGNFPASGRGHNGDRLCHVPGTTAPCHLPAAEFLEPRGRRGWTAVAVVFQSEGKGGAFALFPVNRIPSFGIPALLHVEKRAVDALGEVIGGAARLDTAERTDIGTGDFLDFQDSSLVTGRDKKPFLSVRGNRNIPVRLDYLSGVAADRTSDELSPQRKPPFATMPSRKSDPKMERAFL